VEAAGEVDAHVIVIATHGFAGWKSFLHRQRGGAGRAMIQIKIAR
jgi:hypothetical protein